MLSFNRNLRHLQEKLLKLGESQNQAVLPIFIGYNHALVHLLFAENISEGVTRRGTHQLQHKLTQ